MTRNKLRGSPAAICKRSEKRTQASFWLVKNNICAEIKAERARSVLPKKKGGKKNPPVEWFLERTLND